MSFGIPVRNGLAIGLLTSTTLSSSRGLSPAMSLDFLVPSLDSRITFSRGSNATLVDATGKITYAPANLLRYSEQLDNGSSWTNVAGATVTANTSVAPDGTTTADTVNFSATNANRVEQLSGTAVSGETVIFSIWLRGSGSMRINVGTDTGVGGSSEPTINLTSTWTRYSATVTYSAPTGNRRAMIIWRTGDTATSAEAWGAQLEPVTYQTTPSTYVATTASAYYGPRFDYDPVTLAPKGLLIEEARTNLLLYSQEFDNAAWSKAGITVTANTTASPDGTVNADRITEGAGALARFGVFFGLSASTASAPHTFSVFVKNASGSRFARILLNADIATVFACVDVNPATGVIAQTLNSGATAVSSSVTSAGNGWWRVSITATLAVRYTTIAFVTGASVPAGTDFGYQAYTGDGTSGIFAYGAQLEAASFATSYIPTVASTVTRSTDVATMTGTNFSSWYNQSEGTFVAGFDQLSADNKDVFTAASAGGSFNPGSVGIIASGTTLVGYVRSSSAYTAQSNISITLGNNTPILAAVAYKVNDVAATTQGVTPVVATPPNAMPTTVVELKIMGAGVTGSGKSGHIRQIAYYNTRLPNAQLQTLTAPSLATTLSLSFTNQAYTVGV